MTAIVRTADRPWNILQRAEAGTDFDGAAPEHSVGGVLTPTVSAWTHVFAEADTHVGLFDPAATYYNFPISRPLGLVGVELSLANQSSWSLKLVDAGSREYTLYSGTTETSFVKGWTDEYVLTWGQVLKLTTSGASTAMAASIKLAPVEFFCRRRG